MNLAQAQAIVDRGSDVDRATWTRAQQFVLWMTERGEGGEHVKDFYLQAQPDGDVEADESAETVQTVDADD